jgi:hypothetical protein
MLAVKLHKICQNTGVAAKCQQTETFDACTMLEPVHMLSLPVLVAVGPLRQVGLVANQLVQSTGNATLLHGRPSGCLCREPNTETIWTDGELTSAVIR